MANPPRYIPPHDGYLVLTTTRCFQSRYLLTPSKKINSLVTGVLAKAQEKYGVGICLPAVASNHIHLLLWVQDSEQLARFQNFVNSNIAREIGRQVKWAGKFWDGRYKLDLVPPEEGGEIQIFKYLLAHGCKENLVSRPIDWPGINPARAILSGRNLRGHWVNRTGLYNARRSKSKATVRPVDFREQLEIELLRLPCWNHLSEAQYLDRVRSLLQEIEEETRLRHLNEKSRPLGRQAVLRKDPHFQPSKTKKTPHRGVIAATLTVRNEILQAKREFVRAYRAAAQKLREGDRWACFPNGCFPPPLPYEPVSP